MREKKEKGGKDVPGTEEKERGEKGKKAALTPASPTL